MALHGGDSGVGTNNRGADVMPRGPGKKPRGEQLNVYLLSAFAARLDAVGLTLTKRTGREYSRQDVLKVAFGWFEKELGKRGVER